VPGHGVRRERHCITGQEGGCVTLPMTSGNMRTSKGAARSSHAEESHSMGEIGDERVEDDVIGIEISDDALEAAALAIHSGGYTQYAFCTMGTCPGNNPG
jgi:hypothetical protein